MDVVTWAMYRRQAPELLERERRARVFGLDVAHAAARRVARMVGSSAAQEQPNAAGIAVHYLLGIGPGMAYAHLRRRHPRLAWGKGSVWGAVLFVVNDEIAAPLARVAGGPGRYPRQTHVRGLVGHVMLGVATHLVLEALDSASRSTLDPDPIPDATPDQTADPAPVSGR
ncbi:DUF1440 domain-containing protein [Lentzea xinjiangensis]|nr:DUF1440 domain-containing protein [Lentzea xinjiangensis]